jgi:hypothetical protein
VLSEVAREFLKAATICGVSTDQFRTRDQIVGQMLKQYRPLSQLAIEELIAAKPPMLRKGIGSTYYFTQAGALAARESFPAPPEVPIVSERRIQGRGTTNLEMREYAETVGVRLWSGEVGRCSFCNHQNDHGVAKGAMRLCQVCFRRGERF